MNDEDAHPILSAPTAQRVLIALLTTAGVSGALGFALLLLLNVLSVPGAMYWAVGLAVAGGLLIRRIVLAGEQVGRAVLFALAAGGGAVGGLALARALLG